MQPAVTKLARPATSVLRLQARSSSGKAFVCSGCLQSRQHLLPLSQSGPPQRRVHPTAVLGTSRISKTFYSTSTTNTTTQSPSDLRPPPARSGIAHLESRRLISMFGPDAAKYLQGVITANITQPDGTPRTDPFYAAFLSAKGRVLHDVFIYPYDASFLDPYGLGPKKAAPGERFLIEVDASEATRLVQHIKRYKLRAKFDVDLIADSEAQVWHAWSDNEEALKRKLDTHYESHRDDVLLVSRDPRAPGLGYRMISRWRALFTDPALESDDLPMVWESAYTLHRYRLGIPEGQREILRDQALPLESNIDVMGGIDFRKGCYVGQELTIRTKHRGVVRKRILPVVVSSTTEDGGELSSSDGFDYRPAIGSSSGSGGDQAPLSLPDTEARIGRKEKPDRRVGQFLNGIGNVGLALCRLEVMTDLQVPGETAAAGYNPEKDEFVVSAGTGRGIAGESEEKTAVAPTGGRQLKVRAFMPEWLRKELEKPAH